MSIFLQKNTISLHLGDTRYIYHHTQSIMTQRNPILLSTDTLPGFGLDLIFKIAQQAGFDGIDLALWRSYDAWHPDYVAELSEKYKLPILAIQTSLKANATELNRALEIAQACWTKKILINAPKYFDTKSYSFLTGNLKSYQDNNPDREFSIINPDDSSMSYLPFPKYRFRNIGEILKKYKMRFGFDIANMYEDTIQTLVIGQWKTIIPQISLVYLADRKKSQDHISPWEWSYNLISILKALQKHKYTEPFSIKLKLDKKTLVNNEKVLFQLEKSIHYIEAHFSTV